MSKVLVNSNIGYNFFGIKYDLGPAMETDGMRGTSHLMEHLIVKTFKDKFESLKNLGISWNAYTADDHILFYFSGLEEQLHAVSQSLLNDITGDKTWTEDEFDKEKLTVLQEYEDSFHDHIGGSISNFVRKYYNYYSAIGLREDIENFTYDQSLLFRNRFRRPRNIIEVGSKSVINFDNFDSSGITKSFYEFGNYDSKLEIVPKENKTIVSFLGKKLHHKNMDGKLSMIMYALTGGFDTAFYREIREKRGLSYFSSGHLLNVSFDLTPIFYACTTNDKVLELKAVYEDLLSTSFDKLITKANFEATRNNILIHKKKDEILPHNGVVNTVINKGIYDGIDSITYDEAIALATEHLNINNFQYLEY